MPMIVWREDWNAIIRDVFFADKEMKTLMMLPAKCSIIDFIDKFFIRASYANELVTNEDVRIVYGTINNFDTDAENVKRNVMSFDIYVKKDKLRNATRDRLMLRTELIADRIGDLLTQERYVHGTGYRFWYKGEGEMGTRAAGYERYNVSFYYMRVYN